MTRWWVSLLASINDVVALPWVILIMVLLATAVALGWYTWPAWIPRKAPSWSWLRGAIMRRGRRKRPAPPQEVPVGPEQELEDALPDLPAAELITLADQYAARGQYAEAVRERLRAIVRNLVDRRVIDHHPGWTVTELADAAALARPAVRPPLTEACGIFSTLWYGLRPANHDHDARMRALVTAVAATLDSPGGGGASPNGTAGVGAGDRS